jgi:hypothetical protein
VENCCTGPARMAKTGGRVCCISQIIMLRLMDAEGDLLRKIYVGMQDVEVQTGTQLLPNWYSIWYSIFNMVFNMVFNMDSMFNMDSILLLVHEKTGCSHPRPAGAWRAGWRISVPPGTGTLWEPMR